MRLLRRYLCGFFVFCSAVTPAAAQSDLRGALDEVPSTAAETSPDEPTTTIDPAIAGNASPYERPDPADAAASSEIGRVGNFDDLAIAGDAAPSRLAGPTRRRARAVEEDPFAPIGIRAGAFILRPSIEVIAGHDSNPLNTPDGGGSAYVGTRGEMVLESDWVRHLLTSELRGVYREFRDEGGDELEGSANARLRLDASRTTRLDFEIRGAVDSDDPGDPNVPNGVVNRPLIASFGATAGATWKPNRLSFTTEGAVDRRVYEDAELASGERIDNSDRDYVAYELRLRAAYEVSAALEPFAEIAVNRRVHDLYVDNSGFERGSRGAAIAIGTRFTPSALIELEGRIGYQHQTPDDSSLDDLNGLLVDGSILWRPSALSTVRLTAQTAFDETTIPGSPGSISRAARLEIEHALRRNLVAIAGLGFQRTDYVDTALEDDEFTADLGLEWRLNRSFALTARAAYERLDSSAPDADYSSTLIEIGMRFRR
jgi:hypothetical protein